MNSILQAHFSTKATNHLLLQISAQHQQGYIFLLPIKIARYQEKPIIDLPDLLNFERNRNY